MKIESFVRRSWVKIPVFLLCNVFIIVGVALVVQVSTLLVGSNFLEFISENTIVGVLFIIVVGASSIIYSLGLYMTLTDWAKSYDKKKSNK